jgi:hypothetical protein
VPPHLTSLHLDAPLYLVQLDCSILPLHSKHVLRFFDARTCPALRRLEYADPWDGRDDGRWTATAKQDVARKLGECRVIGLAGS